MTIKFTMLFGAATQTQAGDTARTAGFSESWYSNIAIDSATLDTRCTRLQNARAAILPAAAQILGQRRGNINPTSGSISTDIIFPGRVGVDQDLPMMTLQWTMRSAAGFNERNVELRGIPDDWIKKGEYYPNPTAAAAFRAYFAALKEDGWQMKCVDKSQPRTKIVSISALGVCLCQDEHGLIENDTVDIQSTIDDAHAKWSFQATVSGIVDAETVQLRLPYQYRGFAYVGGRIRRHAESFQTVTITDAEMLTPVAVTRKAGRPFRQFHGRRTAKR